MRAQFHMLFHMQDLDVFYMMKYLVKYIDDIKHPLGTKDMPCRTCRDLIGCHKDITEGRMPTKTLSSCGH